MFMQDGEKTPLHRCWELHPAFFTRRLVNSESEALLWGSHKGAQHLKKRGSSGTAGPGDKVGSRVIASRSEAVEMLISH
jgi:hypothetical protein